MNRPPKGTDVEAPLADRRMTFAEHLQELRVRLRNCMLLLLGAGVAASFFANDFFHFLARPVLLALKELDQPTTIVKLTPSEGFWVQFKLSLVLGLVVALPFIFWELWKFVAPGLYKGEKRLTLGLTAATVVCFLGGAFFGYTLLAKTTHLFLLSSGIQVPLPGHEGPDIKNMLTMESVADFQITMLLGCGVAFELPVVLGLLGWMGLFTARDMWRFNKYALVLAALAGAILTPGSDAYSQLMLAGPLYALYNVSIVVVWIVERRRRELPDAGSPLLLLLAALPALRARRPPSPPAGAAVWPRLGGA